MIFDPLRGRDRVVYAFCAALSHSRYKTIEFVYTQDQKSFVGSHTRMFRCFGGVARCLIPDYVARNIIRSDDTWNPAEGGKGPLVIPDERLHALAPDHLLVGVPGVGKHYLEEPRLAVALTLERRSPFPEVNLLLLTRSRV